MNKWWNYINETNPSYRNRTKRLDKDIGTYLDTGPQKEGSPYKTSRAKFKKKKFNDISAPPGAPGGLEEEVDPATFEKHDVLDSYLWAPDNELKPKIRKRLLKIAHQFIDGLDMEIDIEDIRLTGSLANYNWSKYSDVDLHIVVDFSKIDENTKLVKAFFDNARMRWNELHDIMIHGHEAEIYVEDMGEVHKSSGLYSLMEEEWIIEPTPAKIEFDYPTARKKADAIETQVNLIAKFAPNKPKKALESIARLKEKIRRMRRAGLDSPEVEYSAENIAFKILRREETLDKLNDMKYAAYDQVLSLGE